MKYPVLVIAVLAGALVGCEERAPSQSASTSAAPAPAAAEAASPATSALKQPLAVDESKVSELDAKVLGEAAWTGKACDVRVPDGTTEVTVSKGTASTLEGYVIDPNDAPAGEFDFVLKGGEKSFRIPVSTGWSRPDVAEFFKAPALETAGFQFTTTLQNVPAGRYAVDFVMDRSGAKYFCESGKTVIVQ